MSRPTVNRRTFAKQIAASSLAAGPLMIAAPLAAEEPAKTASPAPDGAPAPPELVLRLLARFYPHPLEEGQRAEVLRQIAEDQARSKILSGFPLTNADEPAPVFAAWRSEG